MKEEKLDTIDIGFIRIVRGYFESHGLTLGDAAGLILAECISVLAHCQMDDEKAKETFDESYQLFLKLKKLYSEREKTNETI